VEVSSPSAVADSPTPRSQFCREAPKVSRALFDFFGVGGAWAVGRGDSVFSSWPSLGADPDDSDSDACLPYLDSHFTMTEALSVLAPPPPLPRSNKSAGPVPHPKVLLFDAMTIL
jgi:hypothetical protein